MLDARRPRARATSHEPQFIGVLGALRAELERRGGDLDAARAVVEAALDRIEFCTEDVGASPASRAAGAAVEADAAERARDLGDDAAEPTRAARGRAARSARVEAAGDRRRRRRARRQATARAERRRARARRARTPPPGPQAAAAWDAADASRTPPRMRAGARPRRTPRRRPRRRRASPPAPRSRRRASARRALAAGRDRGPRRPRPPARSTRAAPRRRRGPAAPEDPFGLTPRERQVLALVAAGRDEPRDRRGAVHGREDRAASTSRGSWPSSTSAPAPRPPRSRTAWGWTRRRPASLRPHGEGRLPRTGDHGVAAWRPTCARAGYELTVYNRTRERAEAFADEHGATVAATPAEVGAASDVVITMVVDGAQVAARAARRRRRRRRRRARARCASTCPRSRPAQARAHRRRAAEREHRASSTPRSPGSSPEGRGRHADDHGRRRGRATSSAPGRCSRRWAS